MKAKKGPKKKPKKNPRPKNGGARKPVVWKLKLPREIETIDPDFDA